jgi:adenine C2-methylase RlmN of 23S rRNA A2503 and tRNA A37
MIKQIGIFKDDIDGSIKSVYSKDEKNIIEMTLLLNKNDIDILCVPSHYYCNLGCKMCYLTNFNIDKKMLPIYIDEFIICLVNSLKNKKDIKRTNNKKLLISFMGVGDVFLNLKLLQFKNVIATPHIAFNSIDAVNRINETTVQNIQNFFDGHITNEVK